MENKYVSYHSFLFQIPEIKSWVRNILEQQSYVPSNPYILETEYRDLIQAATKVLRVLRIAIARSTSRLEGGGHRGRVKRGVNTGGIVLTSDTTLLLKYKN